jgi:HNH endonuclease
MHSILQIAAYWEGRKLPGTDYVPCIDAGEPDCFACGTWGRYDAKAWGREHTWERGVTLERAHVVPRSLDGSDDPENIVLLCHECHLAAPDTAEPQYMWQWLTAHPRTGSPFNPFIAPDFRKAVQTYTGPGKEIMNALASFSDDQLNTIASNIPKESLDTLLRFSYHFGRGPIVSTATWQAVMDDLLRRLGSEVEPPR